MTRPTQHPASNSESRKRLTLVTTPCCDAAEKVARVLAECERAEDVGPFDEGDDAWIEAAVIRAALNDPCCHGGRCGTCGPAGGGAA